MLEEEGAFLGCTFQEFVLKLKMTGLSGQEVCAESNLENGSE